MENLSEEEYLANIINPLVKDKFRVEKIVDDKGVLLNIFLKSRDLSVILGKNGSNIKALRSIMHIFGSQRDKLVSIKANFEERRD